MMKISSNQSTISKMSNNSTKSLKFMTMPVKSPVAITVKNNKYSFIKRNKENNQLSFTIYKYFA